MTQTFQPDNLIAKTSGLAPAAVQAARDRAQEEPAAEQTGLPNAIIDTAADEQFNSIENSTPAAQETVHDAPEIKRDDYYYDSILATIGHKKRAAILLAAQKPAELPITVAVELVIHVIESRKRCLLIDMDPARNAVSAAFDIDINSMQGKAIPTGIDKLWICPADRPDDLAQTPLSRKIANALRYFHYIVIYAPNAADREIQKGFVKTADVAVMFGNTKSPEMQEFSKMLSDSGCRVIAEHEFAATQPLETA